MEKILIIGSGGAGKSTFARRLGALTGIEVFHLDSLYWKPGWIEPSKEEWMKTVEKLLEKDEWILDGNFGGTMDARFTACDTVIFLDFSPLVCTYRIISRRLKYHNQTRPDMGAGCNEKLDLEFLGWVWNFRKNTKPKIEERLTPFENEKTIIRLKSTREVEDFFASRFKL